MTPRRFTAMSTSWWITADRPSLLPAAELSVRTFEARLSRFLPDSAVSRLNRARAATCPTLAAVTRRALALRDATGGAFDPTLGARLSALGYDRPFTLLARRRPSPAPPPAARATLTVRVDGDTVTLDGDGDLDLGGIAKGFTVDHVLAELLAAGATSALVDGGGDLRGAGCPWPVGVGDGLAVDAAHAAVATSSTLRRRWRDALDRPLHHVLDPRTGSPAAGPIDVATAIAPDAATADALATALLVDAPGLLPRLAALGAHALLRDTSGAWWATPGAPLDAPPAPPAARDFPR